MKIFRFFLILLTLILVGGTSSAEIYKWVDENGVVHFSDSPTLSESDTSREAEFSAPGSDPKEKVSSPDPNVEGNPPPTPEPRKITLDSELFKLLDKSKPARVSTHTPNVEIYETKWWGYCKKAKKFFRERGIKFKAYDVEKDEAAASRMMTYTRRRAVPLVVINGRPIQGYNVQAYKQALQN